MSSEEVAISVDKVYKDFKLPHERIGSVKSMFTSLLNGKRSRSYEVQHALKNISFEIKKGEFFGIVGRNGSGKSTLLKIIAGIYQPTRGKVRVNGKLVPFIELGVGFNPDLTGRENVYLNGAILGFTTKQVEANYKKIVEFAELEDFMDQKLKNYSSGMQVRLAFACATMAEAEVLLVDEVLAVGDSEFQRKCFNYFKELKKQNVTVIFVTHDMDAVREYCDRAILVEDSLLIARGKSNEIAARYTKLFSNSPVTEEDNENNARWGDEAIKYIEIKAPKILKNEDFLKFTVTAIANDNVMNPNFGISVKNSSNTYILGTNTRIKKKSLSKIERGQKIQIQWSVPNIFNDGKYAIDLAIVYQGNHQVADWWEEAATFTCNQPERTPYIVNPKIACNIKEG